MPNQLLPPPHSRAPDRIAMHRRAPLPRAARALLLTGLVLNLATLAQLALIVGARQ